METLIAPMRRYICLKPAALLCGHCHWLSQQVLVRMAQRKHLKVHRHLQSPYP